MSKKHLFVLACVILFTASQNEVCADKRPFYIISHMVNSIRQVTHYLNRGGNSLESDIQFYPDGRVKEIYHGFPCDCFRTCTYSVQLADYLKYVREITNPKLKDGYYNRMFMQMFDLKLQNSKNATFSGVDIARHILDYLWTNDTSREYQVRAVIYLPSVEYKDTILGFLSVFKERGKEDMLRFVGFDGGAGDVFEIIKMFRDLPVRVNTWIGDGQTNCISYLYSDSRLRQELAIRDSDKNIFSKTYHWTIDLKLRMRLSLNLGVDAMITNDPEDLVEVLQESYFSPDYRLATVEDDPFERHT